MKMLLFVVKMLISAKKIGKIEDYLTYYVIHENSETTIRDKRIFDIIPITDIIIKDLKRINHPNDSLVSVAVMILTDYTIQQRYVKNIKDRHKFINEAFNYLHNLDTHWKKCSYLNKFSGIKKIIKTNKLLTMLYCDLYFLVFKK